jgi:hypothetical protein
MKNLIRLGVAGALMAGYVTAQAQPLPSSGSSDLWLFVSDASAGTTFAEDTGLSINSIVGTTFAAGGATPPNAVLSTAITANINLAPSSALSAYITAATGAGHTVQWAVEAMQYPGPSTNHPNPGKLVGITDNVASQATNTSNLAFGNLTSWASGFQQDVAYMAATQGTPGTGKSYAFSAGSSTGQVWQPGVTGGFAGATDLYGQGPDTAGVGLGASVNLYALTGNGNLLQAQSYLLGTNLTLTQGGTLTTGSAVPLPAAVWLFGSGLLGLIGVGRRRAAVA